MNCLTRRWVAMLLLSGSTIAASAPPAPATLVPDKSQIVFVTRQMGVPVEGRFKRFDAQIVLDPRHPEGGQVLLSIATGSAGFGIAQTDEELPKPTWFDSAKYPQATFRAETLKALGGGRFEVPGTLELKGQRRALTVPVAIVQSGSQSVATGDFTLRRLDYRIGDGEWNDVSLIANEVQVRFTLTFTGLGPL